MLIFAKKSWIYPAVIKPPMSLFPITHLYLSI